MTKYPRVSKRAVDAAFADLTPSQRRKFFARAFTRLDELINLPDTTTLDVLNALKALDLMMSMYERAEKRLDPARRLFEGMTKDPDTLAEPVFWRETLDACSQRYGVDLSQYVGLRDVGKH